VRSFLQGFRGFGAIRSILSLSKDDLIDPRRRRAALVPLARPQWAAIALALTLLVGCARPTGAPLAAVPSPVPTPAAPVTFPRDAAPHDALVEWWYYTGHLNTADGREFGFELTFFQAVRATGPVGYIAHFAVTDVQGQRFSHQARTATGAIQPTLNFDVGGWQLNTAGQVEQLVAEMTPAEGVDKPYAIRLSLTDRKAPALHNNGYIEYGPAGGSYYYSRTRINVVGELYDGTTTLPVTGQAWMDHQWGNFVVAGRGGWDWFSLQLDDGNEYMLYILRAPDGQSAAYGSRVLGDGRVEDIEQSQLQLETLSTWTSPHTGGKYPSSWRVRVPGLANPIRLTPRVADQELYFPGIVLTVPVYWEGAVLVQDDVTGRPLGKGYVELTGYAGQ
jgi:predicted secreted hydrolase